MTDRRPHPIPARLHPTPKDRAAAWRVILAMLNRDADSVIRVAHESKTDDDIDRFILALADNFQMYLQRSNTDPIAYVESAIAIELAQAEKNGQ